MRAFLSVVPVLATLAGCAQPTGALLAADAASVVVFGRGIVDIGVSAISGRDCSVVRLDRGLTYCAPRDGPVPDRYCTRTLGSVDCWAARDAIRPGVADTPIPSRTQQNYREAPWPKTLTAQP